MTAILKQKILDHVNQQRRSVRELERQAGLHYNAIHNILSDRSKSPSIDTVLKIADAIDCSLDEMLGRKISINKNNIAYKNNITLDIDLFQKTCKHVGEFIDSNHLEKLILGEAIYCVEEIYQYCLNTKSKSFDKNFAQWFLEQNLVK